MNPIEKRLTAIENRFEQNDSVDYYTWSRINGQKKRYGVVIHANELPQSYLNLIDDQYTSLHYVKARYPIAARLTVRPKAALEWDDELLFR